MGWVGLGTAWLVVKHLGASEREVCWEEEGKAASCLGCLAYSAATGIHRHLSTDGAVGVTGVFMMGYEEEGGTITDRHRDETYCIFPACF